MKNKLNRLLLACLLISFTTSVYARPTAKVTVSVMDEEGKPIIGAEVGCVFETPKIKTMGVETELKKSLSDSDGFFTTKGVTTQHGVGCFAKKKGYYRGGAGTGKFTGVSGIIGFRKWKPWNPTIDIVLKKIINPIPMYVGELTGKYKSKTGDLPPELPEEGKFFGYDLIAKDWVVPHGQGLHSDFVFKIDVAYYSSEPHEYDTTMTLKFSNPDDGIQSFYTPKTRGSDLRSSHHAPLTGYQDKLVKRFVRKKNTVLKKSYRDDQNYYFRIRTKRDEQGNIIDAHYGKIYGNIKSVAPRKNRKGKFYFSYYLNPNGNDTNLEFSSEKNLFPKPKDHSGPYRFKP